MSFHQSNRRFKSAALLAAEEAFFPSPNTSSTAGVSRGTQSHVTTWKAGDRLRVPGASFANEASKISIKTSRVFVIRRELPATAISADIPSSVAEVSKDDESSIASSNSIRPVSRRRARHQPLPATSIHPLSVVPQVDGVAALPPPVHAIEALETAGGADELRTQIRRMDATIDVIRAAKAFDLRNPFYDVEWERLGRKAARLIRSIQDSK